MRIRDPGWKKIQIRDKHPGSATLTIAEATCTKLPLPECNGHWFNLNKTEDVFPAWNAKIWAIESYVLEITC